MHQLFFPIFYILFLDTSFFNCLLYFFLWCLYLFASFVHPPLLFCLIVTQAHLVFFSPSLFRSILSLHQSSALDFCSCSIPPPSITFLNTPPALTFLRHTVRPSATKPIPFNPLTPQFPLTLALFLSFLSLLFSFSYLLAVFFCIISRFFAFFLTSHFSNLYSSSLFSLFSSLSPFLTSCTLLLLRSSFFFSLSLLYSFLTPHFPFSLFALQPSALSLL